MIDFQIKGKHQAVGTKEIKKVAEARMRKRKRAMSKLKEAKKKANSLAENAEMSEKQKLRVRRRLCCTLCVFCFYSQLYCFSNLRP